MQRQTGGRHGLLLVHAHPDDESIGTGATIAKYAAEGVPVTLVTCTLGELGEIIPPGLAYLGAGQESSPHADGYGTGGYSMNGYPASEGYAEAPGYGTDGYAVPGSYPEARDGNGYGAPQGYPEAGQYGRPESGRDSREQRYPQPR